MAAASDTDLAGSAQLETTGVTTESIIAVVRDIAVDEIEDGVVFDLDSISMQEIREQADHTGFRFGSEY